MEESEKQLSQSDLNFEQHEPEKKRSGVLNVVVSGLALFSDGYNAQISELDMHGQIGPVGPVGPVAMEPY